MHFFSLEISAVTNFYPKIKYVYLTNMVTSDFAFSLKANIGALRNHDFTVTTIATPQLDALFRVPRRMTRVETYTCPPGCFD